MCCYLSKESEAFEELISAFISIRILIALSHFKIELPDWWMKIDWAARKEQIETLEGFINDAEFWIAFSEDDACTEAVALGMLRRINLLRERLNEAKEYIGP